MRSVIKGQNQAAPGIPCGDRPGKPPTGALYNRLIVAKEPSRDRHLHRPLLRQPLPIARLSRWLAVAVMSLAALSPAWAQKVKLTTSMGDIVLNWTTTRRRSR
jgi:hypothetical protein